MLDPLRRLIGRQSGCSLSDTQLLEQYVTHKDAASFEVLVWRHGAMVLGLCRRILREEHEAEDAFQATFLVFARKANSVGTGESVGSWLYKVAYRVALRLRSAAQKRPTQGELSADPPAPEQPDDACWRELRPVLDDEIARLPEKYRAPFVLCYLQGRTNEEAAVELGCPKGTVLSRLARGREWLRDRLTRRGLAPGAVALALNLSSQAASAVVPATLAQSTAAVAIPFAAGVTTELLPAHITALAEGVIRTMIATKLKIAAAMLVTLSVLGTGIGLAAFGGAEERGRPANPAPPAAERSPAAPAGERNNPPEREKPVDRAPTTGQRPPEGPVVRGKVVEVAKDGKSFTVETPAADRVAPVKHTVKIGDKTTVIYNGVGPDGATPTQGYQASVSFPDPPGETATAVTFNGFAAGRHMPDVTGTFAGAKAGGTKQDASVLLVEVRQGGRGTEPKTEHIHLDDKTVVTFSNVGPDGAKMTPGLGMQVWYTDDEKTAGVVKFVGTAAEGRRDENRPDKLGKVVGVADEGKTLTVEVPGGRGEEPTKFTVKMNDKTSVVFNNVPLDGAKPAEGQQAQVWLVDGSKNTAAKLALTAPVPERWTTLSGKVVAVSKDGSSFTLEQPATVRGEEPTRIEIKLSPKARIAYVGVGPGEAKLTEGLLASVALLDGSKNTGAQVVFRKETGGRGR
jgi:RNA polymerase sigma factor (sigma-70 family)